MRIRIVAGKSQIDGTNLMLLKYKLIFNPYILQLLTMITTGSLYHVFCNNILLGDSTPTRIALIIETSKWMGAWYELTLCLQMP